MKVKDLIKRLQEFPEDYAVIVASDPEGNTFYHLATVEPYVYIEYGSDIEIVENGKPYNCVVIWP